MVKPGDLRIIGIQFARTDLKRFGFSVFGTDKGFEFFFVCLSNLSVNKVIAGNKYRNYQGNDYKCGFSQFKLNQK